MPVYDPEKEKAVTPKNNGSHDDLGVSDDQRQKEIEEMEKLHSGEAAGEPTKADQDEVDSLGADNGGGPWKTDVGKKSGGRLSNLASQVSGMSWGKKGLLGGGILGIFAAAAIGLFSFSPFELININQIGLTKIGGVQSRVYRLGRNRLYSSMFFFDKDGKFAGYKSGGLRRLMLENRKTKQLTDVMSKNGFDVEFEEINGKQTGYVKKITYNGDTIAESSDQLQRAWDVKNDSVSAKKFRAALEEVFPEETARWYGSTSKKLWRRWGLTRTNWLKDTVKEKTGLTALESAELSFRRKLRERLFGSTGDAKLSGKVTPNEEANNTTDGEPNQALKNSQNLDGANQFNTNAANELNADLIADPADTNANHLGNVNPADTAETVGKEAGGSVAQGLKVTGYIDSACSLRSALSTLEKGARVARAYQLMNFSLAVSTIGDGLKKGKVTGAELLPMMNYINKKGDDGSNFFSSGGWQYYTGNKGAFNKGSRDKYSTGGGFTGTLAQINNTANLGGVSKETCKTLNNPFVQIGSGIAGIGLAIQTGGTSVLVEGGLSVGADILKNTVINIGTQMLIPIIAGTTIDGSEKGADIGDAWTSGFEVMNSANASNAGMRPLSKQEFAVLEKGYQDDRKVQLADMSIKDRYLSLKTPESLTYKLAMAKSSFKFSSLLSNLGNVLGSSLGRLNPAQKAYAENDLSCPDPDITNNNLAATPFCNLEMGIPDSVIENPNMSPADVELQMQRDGHIDDSGNPKSEAYKSYIEQCTSDNDEARSLDIIHKDDGSGADEYTDECTANPLFNLYRLYLGIAQSENEALTGKLDDGSTPSQSQPTTSEQTITGDPFGPSEDVACAANTIDLGVQDAYNNGQQVKQKLCAIPNISSNSPESTVGNPYYIEKADGKVIVNSRVSGAVYSMGQAAISDGVQLAAASSFRSMAHQEALWQSMDMDTTKVARPGYSNHQNGTAIDFQINAAIGGQTCDTRASAPGNKKWDWLYANAVRFGYKQYSAEAWHWDPGKEPNRC